MSHKCPSAAARLGSLSHTFVWVVAFILAFVAQAHAAAVETASDASTLGDMLCNAYVNTKPFAYLFEWTAYVCGAALGIHSIHRFRLHTENPNNAPLVQPVMLMCGAACLLALPEAAGTIIDSLYGGNVSYSQPDCSPGAASGGATLDEMMVSFVGNIKGPLLSFVSMTAIAAGLFMIIRGLAKASKYGFDPKTHSVNSILTNIVFGALLMTIGDNLDMVMDSVFGTTKIGGSSAISWSLANQLAGGASAQFKATVVACLTFVQLLGAIAFVRGWLILKKVVETGGQGLGQGITHVLGGVLAINIYTFLKIMDSTFGTGML